MPAPINTLKHRLIAGETLHGIWLGMADPYAAEIAASAGFDWLLIDGEHAPNDIRSISAQLAVLRGGPSAPIVRLPIGDPVMIKQALDIGAQTLLIPMVDSAEQATDLVRATRYPPEGVRGVGSALARASEFSGIADYLTTANEQICLIVQVESVKGLAALDEILAVEGVDGVFIGPADLAADMGLLGAPDHTALREAVYEALRRIRASGRFAGFLATEPDFIEGCKAAGGNFAGVGIDVTSFANGLRGLAARFGG
ncbi:2-keto-3-deoxy-L-rhamnonate aldolase (plasmid) [Pseudorhodobacter turbinis]|uniref:Hydroxypyruvate/pyruvate aldolase n=1 Tax=Pseudorhodobacter turbinis TaxID=2500533 RepID=A0A4P8ELD0_9RHOB|nr:HpcH/HpaI aldolase/citrate lyase family protein [Pseudorhodobacter turbinis]QCO57783.1 2-keto-3-deoxy-L-rhamnonate aldolase [Pseudorhodobacter turbinis]